MSSEGNAGLVFDDGSMGFGVLWNETDPLTGESKPQEIDIKMPGCPTLERTEGLQIEYGSTMLYSDNVIGKVLSAPKDAEEAHKLAEAIELIAEDPAFIDKMNAAKTATFDPLNEFKRFAPMAIKESPVAANDGQSR